MRHRATLDVNGHAFDIAYQVGGEGPPLLLIHGLGASSMAWHFQLERLAEGHRVFAIDLPGHGASPPPPGPVDGDLAADVVVAFLEQVLGGPAAVAGHSLGGALALLVTLRRPRLVSALALVSSAGLGRELSLSLRLMCLPGADRLVEVAGPWLVRAVGRVGPLRRRFAGGGAVDVLAPVLAEALDLYRERHAIRAFTTALRAVAGMRGQRARYVLADRLGELDVPVLVVWGSGDRVLPLVHGLRAAEAVRGRFEVLDCGHSPMLEAAARFTEVLREFLAGVAPRPALA
ncbi:MAG: alpha/beta fold hydrolase [Chloroflexi bacterium]|nr:MAG: alpha/beta fold hydrolase [Chloroflexota bacterium]